jgi:hypothetical protein
VINILVLKKEDLDLECSILPHCTKNILDDIVRYDSNVLSQILDVLFAKVSNNPSQCRKSAELICHISWTNTIEVTKYSDNLWDILKSENSFDRKTLLLLFNALIMTLDREKTTETSELLRLIDRNCFQIDSIT